MPDGWLLALAAALALGGVHAVAPWLDRIPQRHEGRLASVIGGASLGYVLLYLLYELASEGAGPLHALVIFATWRF